MSRKPVTLYGFGYADRSGRIRWLFEELGVPYTDHFLEWERRDHQSTEYLQINPMGRVPSVVDGAKKYTESGAICLAYADEYPDKGLAPAPGSELRGAYYQWILFATATLEPQLEKIWRAKEAKDLALEEVLSEELKAASLMLESALSGQDYLVGNKFSAADICIASLLNWGDMLMKLSPVFKPYFDRLKARPACKRARIFD